MLGLHAFVLVALSGCDRDDPPPSPAISLTGTVIASGPVAGATITARDAIGKTVTATTDGTGGFSLSFPTISYPVLIKAESLPAAATSPPLWAVLSSAPTGRLTVSPLTSAVVHALTRGEAALAFDTLDLSTATRSSFTVTRLDTIEAGLREALRAGLLGGVSATLAQRLETARYVTALTAQVTDDELRALLQRAAQGENLWSLVSALAVRVTSTALACDVTARVNLPDGSPRPACANGSNTPLSVVAMGGVRTLPYPTVETDPVAWADLLSGQRERLRHWKTYRIIDDPVAHAEGFRTALTRFLGTQWSQADLDLLMATLPSTSNVDRAESLLRATRWEGLAASLRFDDVSSITHSWYLLRDRLGTESGRLRLFGLSDASAIRLMAPPAGHVSPPTLGVMSTVISAALASALADPSNRQGGLPDPAYATVLDRYAGVIDVAVQAGNLTGRCGTQDCEAAARSALLQLELAIQAVPIGEALLLQRFDELEQQTLALVLACPNSAGVDILSPEWTRLLEGCTAAFQSWQTAGGALLSELTTAQQQSAALNQDSPSAYFARFAENLRNRLEADIRTNFSRYWPADDQTGDFRPVVAHGEVRRGAVSAEVLNCCLTRAEVDASIETVFYRVDGTAIQFAIGPDGRVDPFTWDQSAIVRTEVTLPALTQAGVSSHSPPLLWVLDEFGNVQARALACSGADGACLAALGRSRVERMSAGSVVGHSFLASFTSLHQLIIDNGGMPLWQGAGVLEQRPSP
jgi:hypothetical protein